MFFFAEEVSAFRNSQIFLDFFAPFLTARDLIFSYTLNRACKYEASNTFCVFAFLGFSKAWTLELLPTQPTSPERFKNQAHFLNQAHFETGLIFETKHFMLDVLRI